MILFHKKTIPWPIIGLLHSEEITVNTTICKNKVVLVSETMESTPFNSIEIWLNFGTGKDPDEYHGMAHLIEHALYVSFPRAYLYPIYHSYGKTSLDRIRIYAEVHQDELYAFFEQMLHNILDLPISEEELEFQKKKVFYEIEHLSRSVLSDYIFSFYQSLFKGTGYSRNIAGAESVMNISLSGLKDYLSKALRANGMVVSVSGCLDSRKIIEIIERVIDPISYPTNRYLHNWNCLTSKASPLRIDTKIEGGASFIATRLPGMPKALNTALSDMMNEYMRFVMREYPMQIFQSEHLCFSFLAVYFPDLQGSATLLYQKLIELSTEAVDESTFKLVRQCLYYSYLAKQQRAMENALFNIQSFFYEVEVPISEILQILDTMDFEIFRKYAFELLCSGNAINMGALAPR